MSTQDNATNNPTGANLQDTNMVPGTGVTTGFGGKADKIILPDFNGDKHSINISEWLARFDSHSKHFSWSDAQKVDRIRSYTTGKAWTILSKLIVTGLTPQQELDLIQKTLQKTFGLSPEGAFRELIAMTYKDDVDRFAADLQHLVYLSFADLDAKILDRITTRFFWNSLPQTAANKQLASVWRRGEQSLETALDICRDSIDPTDAVHHFHGGNKWNKWHGPNKWNKWTKHKISKPKWTQGGYTKEQRCYTCGGKGHYSPACPSHKAKVGNFLIISLYDYLGLIDTGASITCVSENFRRNVLNVHIQGKDIINTVNSHQIEFGVVSNVSILNVELKRVLVSPMTLNVINGRAIDLILGMDWIEKKGGFSLFFVNGNPSVTFPNTLPNVLNVVSVPKPFTIEKDDFILTRICIGKTEILGDTDLDTYRWEVEWKWRNNTPPPPRNLPAAYTWDKLSSSDKLLLQKELELWKTEGYILPLAYSDHIAHCLPIIAVSQPHKSTVMRPCLDYRYINEYLLSSPNEDLTMPVAAQNFLRKWRASGDRPMFLIDIRKAYMQVHIKSSLWQYQCVKLPYERNKCYYLTRLGFGLNIAPKVLRILLAHILFELKSESVSIYLDDMYVAYDDIEHVTRLLLQHGFVTKPPEAVHSARVLGLQNSDDGNWSRYGPLPRLVALTRRGVHCWTGRLIAHYPVGGWLRPCCSALKRLCPSNWDEPLDEYSLRACTRLQHDIEKRGDPVRGKWGYDPSKTWILFTDSSISAFSAVLMIGGIYVEDSSWLRKVSDNRHINVAELEAVHKGLGLVVSYMKCIPLSKLHLYLKCDNKSVVSWLTRSQDRHWRSTKGMSSHLIERRLHEIAELCNAMNLTLSVELIPSEHNISDPVSRIPDYLKSKDESFDSTTLQQVICTLAEPVPVHTNDTEYVRDEFGRIIVDNTQLQSLMSSLHEHEGAQSLYDRLRLLVSYPQLRQACQNFVRNCHVCQLGRVTRAAPIIRTDTHMQDLPNDSPFSTVHMDVCGPFGEVDGISQFYIVTLVDRFSHFCIARCTFNTPVARDAVLTLRQIFENFHICPSVCVTDNGSIFIAQEFSLALVDLNCRGIRTAVSASWSNGRVERVHRVFNERLRCLFGEFTFWRHVMSRMTQIKFPGSNSSYLQLVRIQCCISYASLYR